VCHSHRRHIFLFGHPPRVVCARRQFPSVFVCKLSVAPLGSRAVVGRFDPAGMASTVPWPKIENPAEGLVSLLAEAGSQFEVLPGTSSA